MAGGTNVTLSDGRSVFIKQLPIKDYPAFLKAQEDEPEQVKMLTGLDVETIKNADIELIIAEGDRINADFFGRWFQRKLARMDRLMPGTSKRLTSQISPQGAPTAGA